MLTNFCETNSIISQWIQEIRDEDLQKDSMRFRRNMERIGEIIGYEISKMLPYKQKTIQTPMSACTCAVLEEQPVLATILRAGLPLYQGLLHIFDGAESAFIGAYRKHKMDDSFEIHQQYMTSPPLSGRALIVADPMLATGSSLVLALTTLLEHDQPTQIHVVTAIACTTGINHLQQHFPDAHIWTAAIDDELTDKGYIVPGLGDAGDLAYGKKRQF